MEQRVSLITLGVRDFDASVAFYTKMGWARVDSPDGVAAFDMVGQTLGLYPMEALAKELGKPVDDIGGFSGVVLSHNVREKSDVGEILSRVAEAGGTVLREAQDVFWGGHHGHFADPDGHIWEVAHNPFSPLKDDGAFRWNGY